MTAPAAGGAAVLLAQRYRERATVMLGTGDPQGASRAARRAFALAPGALPLLVLWGAAERGAGRAAAALEMARRATRQSPDSVAFWINRGNAAADLGESAEMISSFHRALRLAPADAEAWQQLGAACGATDAMAESVRALRRAAVLRPGSASVLTELGMALAKAGRTDHAVAVLRRATALQPAMAEPYLAAGNAELAMGRAVAARDALVRGAAVAPGSRALRQGLALACQAAGEPARGFRLDATLIGAPPAGVAGLPRWDGRRSGACLVVWPSGGVGDEIRQISMLPQLGSRVAGVQLVCDRRLVPMIRRCLPWVVATPADAPFRPVAADAHQFPLAALQPLLRARVSDFPPAGRYLHPRGDLVERWRGRLDALGPGLKVGLAWRSGRASVVRGRHHGDLVDYTAILGCDGVVAVLLQYDDCLDEVVRVERALGVTIHRWPDLDRRDDFEGMAALTAALDVVVTTGSAVMTVAGSVDAETWCILRAGHHVQLGTERLPWFPTVRVFPWAWDEPLGSPATRIAAALRRRAADVGG